MEYLIDLRSQTSAIGNQGRRPTCVSFALSACHEFVHELPPRELSKDCLHRRCVEKDRATHGGVRIITALSVLTTDGQALENVWPYRSDLDEDAWLCLPSHDVSGTSIFKIAKFNCLTVTDPNNLVEILRRSGPVCLVVRIYESFFFPCDGQIRLPNTRAEEFRGNHALCVIGVTTDESVLVRNSWGTTWGDCGHVRMPFRYLREHALGLYVLSSKETGE